MNAGLDETALCRNPDVVQAYRNDPLVHGKGTARLATELAATVAATQAAAGEFRPPLLICHGTADRLTDPEASRRFFERVPHENKAYFAYEGGYHEGHNDIHRERVIIDIAHWLEAQIAIAAQHAENSEETHG